MIYDYWNTQSAYSAYNTASATSTTSVSASGSYLDITGNAYGSNYASGSDSADISETARELINRIKSLDVYSCIYPDNNPTKGAKSLFDIENDFMSDFSSFAGAIGGLVGSDSTVTMGLDGRGGMIVQGDESAASRVSSSFNSTSTARFAIMAARAALMDAGQTVDGFADAYASDPYAAIQDNIDALGERLLGFRVQAGGGTAQYGFMRDVEIEYSETTASYGESVAAAADN